MHQYGATHADVTSQGATVFMKLMLDTGKILETTIKRIKNVHERVQSSLRGSLSSIHALIHRQKQTICHSFFTLPFMYFSAPDSQLLFRADIYPNLFWMRNHGSISLSHIFLFAGSGLNKCGGLFFL